jgi:hypothetical protein
MRQAPSRLTAFPPSIEEPLRSPASEIKTGGCPESTPYDRRHHPDAGAGPPAYAASEHGAHSAQQFVHRPSAGGELPIAPLE